MFAYYARWIKNYSAKVRPLIANTKLPLDSSGRFAFETLRNDLVNAFLASIDDTEPFTVECGASNYAKGATLNQNGRPVAFASKTLSPSVCRYSTVEKEAKSIVEVV